ncbi:YbhB/YbcL family Raf kinase inhibitor-like protein [Micromonosporaceae bacterium Da 78-11]
MTYDPYALAFPAAAFTVTGRDFADGGALPASAYATDDTPGTSPELAWQDLPTGTKSLVVTAFDADAPIPGGLWHWLVKDIPATSTGLVAGAGQALPPGAVHLSNDLGQDGYSGAKPPPGTGTHRMFFCVTALDVDTLDVPAGASTALLHILMVPHTLGRAVVVATSTAASV